MLQVVFERLSGVAAGRVGYRVVALPREDWVTVYLISNKGRAVGAVCVDSSGDEVPAGSVREAFDWYESDRAYHSPIGGASCVA